MVTGRQLGWVAHGVSRREVGWRQVPGRMEGASDPQSSQPPWDLDGICTLHPPPRIPMHAYHKADLSHTTVSKEDSESTHQLWEQKRSLICSGIYYPLSLASSCYTVFIHLVHY